MILDTAPLINDESSMLSGSTNHPCPTRSLSLNPVKLRAANVPTAEISTKETPLLEGARPGRRVKQWRSVPNMLFVTSPASGPSMPPLFRSI